MTTTETWRVVLESGEVRDVRVTPLDNGNYVAMSGYVDGEFDHQGYGDTQRTAVAELSTDMREGWPVVEIVAPGSLTSAEKVAAETERCIAACQAVDEAHSSLSRWSESPAAYRAEGATECIDAIRESAR